MRAKIQRATGEWTMIKLISEFRLLIAVLYALHLLAASANADQSLAQLGGNITGLTALRPGNVLELLKESVPKLSIKENQLRRDCG